MRDGIFINIISNMCILGDCVFATSLGIPFLSSCILDIHSRIIISKVTIVNRRLENSVRIHEPETVVPRESLDTPGDHCMWLGLGSERWPFRADYSVAWRMKESRIPR